MRCLFKLSGLGFASIVSSIVASIVIVIFVSSTSTHGAKAQQSSIPDLAKFAAAPTSAVKKFDHSTVRLLKGNFENGAWEIGVEIKMGPKWKTYWRVPGDAGVPPEFIWKNSTNLAVAKVSYPAPKRYEDNTGKAIGYKKHVIFPVKITPSNAGKPVKLDLRFYYAICSDICVPAQANIGINLSLNGQASVDQASIDTFKAKVPKADESRISINKAEILRVNGKPNLAVSLTGKLADKTDILVEGFDDAFFDAPSSSRKGNQTSVFLLPIEGLESDAMLSGKTLKLTVLSGNIALVGDVVVK